MSTERYIHPLTDFGFKKLFGSEPNQDILKHFLNSLLPEKHHIASLSYDKNEHLGQGIVDRKAIFDIYCVSESGERFIVEVQKAKQTHFIDRSLYYTTFPIQEQGKQGVWDFKLAATYSVNLLDFEVQEFAHTSRYIHRGRLKDEDNHVLSDKLAFIFIELPKFTKTLEVLEDEVDKWLYVLRHLAALDTMPSVFDLEVFKKLFHEAALATYSPQDRRVYEDSLKHYRDWNNILSTQLEEGIDIGQEKGIEIGRKEGIEIGREEGIEIGLDIGREEGIEIGGLRQAQNTARQMKQEGMATASIQRFTGLSLAEIDDL